MISKILIILSLSYSLVFLFFCFLSFFINMKYKKNILKVGIFFLIVSLGIISFFSTDNSIDDSGWDVNRYYIMINDIKSMNFKEAMTKSYYSESPIISLIFFIVSRMKYAYWTQVFLSIPTIIMIMYILYDSCVNEQKSVNLFLCDTFILFALYTSRTLLLGSRNALAFAFCILGIYIYKKKNSFNFKTLILILLGAMTHPAALIFFLIWVTCIINKKIIYVFIPIFIVLLKIFSNLKFNIPFLNFSYEKLQEYFNIPIDDKRIWVLYIFLFVLYFLIYVLSIKDKTITKNEEKIGNSLMVNTFSCLLIPHLFLRLLPNSICLTICSINYQLKKKNALFTIFILIVCLGLLAYELVFAINYWHFRYLF